MQIKPNHWLAVAGIFAGCIILQDTIDHIPRIDLLDRAHRAGTLEEIGDWAKLYHETTGRMTVQLDELNANDIPVISKLYYPQRLGFSAADAMQHGHFQFSLDFTSGLFAYERPEATSDKQIFVYFINRPRLVEKKDLKLLIDNPRRYFDLAP